MVVVHQGHGCLVDIFDVAAADVLAESQSSSSLSLETTNIANLRQLFPVCGRRVAMS